MEISGHRHAPFLSYHSVSERRLKEMAGKLALHLKAKDEEQKTAARIYPVNSTEKTAGEDRPQMLR